MGILADTALAAGGEVIGVMPQDLIDREIGHAGLTELRVVGSMHERKALMAELSDGFVALPGGAGTLEELIEVYTWSQLGLHDKPMGVLNVRGYYDGLAALLDHAVQEGFLRAQHRAALHVAATPAELLGRVRGLASRATVGKWLDRTGPRRLRNPLREPGCAGSRSPLARARLVRRRGVRRRAGRRPDASRRSNAAFTPSTVALKPGDTLTIRHDDGAIEHELKFADEAHAAPDGRHRLDGDAHVRRRPSSATQPYVFVCSLHPR